MTRVFVSILMILSAALASLTSLHSVYWFFPLIFCIVPLIGYNVRRLLFLDSGIPLLIISYLFVNRVISFTTANLLSIIGFFFLFVGVWFYARNTLLVSGIDEVFESSSDKNVQDFKRSALNDLFGNVVMGFFLAVFAGLIGAYSSLEMGIGANIEIILMVIFSSAVFFILYLLINIFSWKKTA